MDEGVNFTAILSRPAPRDGPSCSSSDSDDDAASDGGSTDLHHHRHKNRNRSSDRTHHNHYAHPKQPAGARHAPYSPASPHAHHEPDQDENEEEGDREGGRSLYSSTNMMHARFAPGAAPLQERSDDGDGGGGGGSRRRNAPPPPPEEAEGYEKERSGYFSSPVYMMHGRKALNPNRNLLDESNSFKDSLNSVFRPEVYLPVFYSLRMTLLVALPLGILARHPKTMNLFPAHPVIPLWGIVDSRNTVGEQIAFSIASYQCGLWTAVWGELNNIFGLYFHHSAWWCAIIGGAFFVALFGDYRNKRFLIQQGVLILQMEYLAGGYEQKYAVKVGRDLIMATTFSLLQAFIPPKSVARQCDLRMAKGWKHIGLVVRSSVHALWSEDPIVCVTELSRLTTEPLQTLFNDLPGQFFFVMYEFWESTLRLELRRERLIVMKDCTPSLHALTDCVRSLVMRRIQRMTISQQEERDRDRRRRGGGKRKHRKGEKSDNPSGHVPFGDIVPPEQDCGMAAATVSVKGDDGDDSKKNHIDNVGEQPVMSPQAKSNRFHSKTSTLLWGRTRAMLRQPTEEFLEALDAVLAGLGETLNPHDVRATVPFDRLQTSAEELQATLHRVHFETLIRGEQEVNPFFYSNTIFFHLTMLSLAHQLVAYGERMRNFDRRRYKSAWRRIVEFFFLDYWNRFWEDLPNRLFLKTPRDIRIVKDAIKISLAFGVGAMYTNYMDPENSYYFGMAILMGVGWPTAGDTMVASVYRITGMVIACSIAYVATWHMPNLTCELALSLAGVFIAGLFRGVQPYAHTAIYCSMLILTNLNSASNKYMLLCRIVSNCFTVVTYYAICVFIFPINVLKVSYSIQFRAVAKVRERFSGLVDLVLQPSLGYSDDDDDDDDEECSGSRSSSRTNEGRNESNQKNNHVNQNNNNNNDGHGSLIGQKGGSTHVAHASSEASERSRRAEHRRRVKENAALAQQFIRDQLMALEKSRKPMWDLVTQVGIWVPKAAAEPTLYGLPYPLQEMKTVVSSLKRLASATDVLWQGINTMYRTHHRAPNNNNNDNSHTSTGSSWILNHKKKKKKNENNSNNREEEMQDTARDDAEHQAVEVLTREAVLHIIHGIAPVLVQIDHHVGIVMQDFIDAQTLPLTWTPELATEHFSEFLALRYDIHIAFDRAHQWYVKVMRRNFRERVRARALRAAVLANKSFQFDPASGSPSLVFLQNATSRSGSMADAASSSGGSLHRLSNSMKELKQKEKDKITKKKKKVSVEEVDPAAKKKWKMDVPEGEEEREDETSTDDDDDEDNAPYSSSSVAKDLAATFAGPSRSGDTDNPLTDDRCDHPASLPPTPIHVATTTGGGGGGGALKEETTATTLSRSQVAEALLPLTQQAEEEEYRRMTARRDLLNNKKITPSSSFAAPSPTHPPREGEPEQSKPLVAAEKSLNGFLKDENKNNVNNKHKDNKVDGVAKDGVLLPQPSVHEPDASLCSPLPPQPPLSLDNSKAHLGFTMNFASPDEDNDEYNLNNDVNMIISLLVSIDMFFGEAERLLKSMFFINQYERSRAEPVVYDKYAGFM